MCRSRLRGPGSGRPPSQASRLDYIDLMAALRRLPVGQREAVLLIGLEGMSYLEAARACAVPIGTIMSRLSRGREALRRLTDANDDPEVGLVK